ncbi:MAG: hypothetical protein GTN74_00820 [Proteobacteria bacterium]|nr:hypothetical protein [Pseudomonadota bacterium]NIS67560.1 hypothetical protein [Pseudomonadota bacterium]
MSKSNTSIRRSWLHIITYGFGFFSVAILFIFLEDSKDKVARLLEASALVITLCILAHCLSLLVQSMTQVLMARTLKVQLGWGESLSLTVIGRLGNLFTPFRLGTVYRAIYMKTVHQMVFSKFVSIFLGFSLVVYGTSALVATVSVVVVFALHNRMNWTIVFSIIVALAISLFFIWLPRDLRWSEGRWVSRLRVFLESWYAIRRSRASILSSTIGSFASILTFVIAYKLAFSEIGNELSWAECAMVASIGGLIKLIQLVPGSLGIYEGSVAFLAHTLGLPPSAGLSVAVLFRLCQVAILIALIGPSWIYMRDRLYDEPNNPIADEKPGACGS